MEGLEQVHNQIGSLKMSGVLDATTQGRCKSGSAGFDTYLGALFTHSSSNSQFEATTHAMLSVNTHITCQPHL